MHRPAVLFPIVLSLGPMVFMPATGAQADDAREFGPTPIKQCQTIDKPGSYVLVKNLTATGPATPPPVVDPTGQRPGDCLVITASFVTIDLAGFAIFGNSTRDRGPAGIVAIGPNVDDIAVRNGSISGFFDGIDLVSRTSTSRPPENPPLSSIVEQVRASDNAVGIIADGIVRNNTALNNPTAGISASGVVTGNVVNGSQFGGFNVQGTVIGNTAKGNGIGFIVRCPSNVIDNTAPDTGQTPIETDPFNGAGCNIANNAGF